MALDGNTAGAADRPRVVVVGSVNLDVVARVERLPEAGETIPGSGVALLPGGKGANQAVAAHRLGADVRLVGAVGDDAFGRSLLEFLGAEGLGLDHVERLPGPSGTALITVDGAGQNTIVIVAGANGRVDAGRAGDVGLCRGDVVLLQNEIPAETNGRVAAAARERGATVVLNLAPYREPEPALLDAVGFLILNETEFAALLGRRLPDPGPGAVAGILATERVAGTDVVVTLGARGVVARIAGSVGTLPAHPVPVVDTTGAGDAFCGAFGAALAAGIPGTEALAVANAAAAISVQHPGAAPSMPGRGDVERLLARPPLPCGDA